MPDPTIKPGEPTTTIAPISVAERESWNRFIDFLSKSGFKSSAQLDVKGTKLGEQLMNRFKAENPDAPIDYSIVPKVQQSMLDMRQQALNDVKAGKVVLAPGVTEKDFLPNLSPADGWLGSRTSSFKFPTAQYQIHNGTALETKNYGVDYDQHQAAVKAGKLL